MVARTIPPEHLAFIERIARWLIRRLPPHVTTFDDLVSAGYLGYHDAVGRYDAARIPRFEAFAAHRIRGAMLDALRQRDPLSREHRATKHRREGVEARLTSQLGRPPTRGEIAHALGMTEDAVETLDRVPSNPELLADHTDVQGMFAEIADERADEQAVFNHCVVREAMRRIAPAFSLLSPRERYVLHARFVDGLCHREIAAVLEIDKSRVCQLQQRAIAKLRVAYETPVAMAA